MAEMGHFPDTTYTEKTMPRMQILSMSEREAFDRPPVFDFSERKRCFDLPKPLMDIATKLRSPASQIGFVVMCAYFKSAKRFYNPPDFHASDIERAAKLLGLSGPTGSKLHIWAL